MAGWDLSERGVLCCLPDVGRCFYLLSDDRNSTNDLLLGFTETIDWLATANSVRWYGDVLRREDGRV